MRLFGSGINFYGGPGESAHKHFIKIPGPRTQRRVSKFAQQTALQYHDMLVSRYAAKEGLFKINNCKQHGEVLNTLESMSTPVSAPRAHNVINTISYISVDLLLCKTYILKHRN